MNRGLRAGLLLSSALSGAAGTALPALAQSTLETVIVTAEKETADVQKTGLSIATIAPNLVEPQGQARLQDILANVPAVSVYRANGTNASFFIRGIGTTQGVSSTLEMLDGISV